jgi:hypothetical protein
MFLKKIERKEISKYISLGFSLFSVFNNKYIFIRKLSLHILNEKKNHKSIDDIGPEGNK